MVEKRELTSGILTSMSRGYSICSTMYGPQVLRNYFVNVEDFPFIISLKEVEFLEEETGPFGMGQGVTPHKP